LAKILKNKNGGLKNIPPGARRIVLLNQADTPELQSAAKIISNKLIPDYHSAIIASLSGYLDETISNEAQPNSQELEIHAVIEQTAGIILAAGGSSRFGEPKQLLKWKGKPLIRQVALTALKAGLSPVIVVVGSSSAEVGATIIDLPLRIVNNSDWKAGMSTSIRAGIAALPDEVGGAVFMQADQPQIPSQLIKSLVESHAVTLNPILAPQIDGQRGNPVLFDSCTFPVLLSLEGDIGGRALFSRFPVQWVPWLDPNLLLDIDSTEDFRKFLQIYPDNKEKV
jgi:molybdenum cofactor cytidylyltransferase